MQRLTAARHPLALCVWLSGFFFCMFVCKPNRSAGRVDVTSSVSLLFVLAACEFLIFFLHLSDLWISVEPSCYPLILFDQLCALTLVAVSTVALETSVCS